MVFGSYEVACCTLVRSVRLCGATGLSGSLLVKSKKLDLLLDNTAYLNSCLSIIQPTEQDDSSAFRMAKFLWILALLSVIGFNMDTDANAYSKVITSANVNTNNNMPGSAIALLYRGRSL